MIRTKLNKPPISTFHVSRESILESLGFDRYKPLTLVSAPAGYGKTETVSSWLDRYNHSYGWISLSRDENDLRLFLTYLASSIHEFAPDSSKKIQETVSAMKLPSVKQLVEEIINELDKIEQPFFLVLDDYHKISNWSIHEFIDLIVQFPPENMSLVLITRRDPGLQLHLYRAYGKIHEIRMHDLSFSQEETKKLMVRFFDSRIEEETIRHLHLQTEGWITGLQLATLLTKQEPDPNQSLRKISAQPHVLMEFLKLEILDGLSEPFQHLLLLLSVPDRFNASLIDALILNLENSMKPDSAGTGFLNWLLESNLFIKGLDSQGEWYRFHHLFQDLLRAQLKTTFDSEFVQDITRKISNWFEANGYLDEALDCAVEAGDWANAIRIVESNRATKLDNDQFFRLERWMSKLPMQEVLLSQKLLLSICWIHYYKFQFEEVAQKIVRIKTLELQGQFDVQDLAELHFFESFLKFWAGDSEKAAELSHGILYKMKEDLEFELFVGDSMLYYGLSLQDLGKTGEAYRYLTQARLKHPTKSGTLYSRICAAQVFVALINTDFSLARKILPLWHKDAQERDVLYLINWVLFCEGIMSFQEANFDDAISKLSQVTQRKHLAHVGQVCSSSVGLAVMYGMRKDFVRAEKELEALFCFAEESNLLKCKASVESGRARLALMKRDSQTIRQWVESFDSEGYSPQNWAWLEVPMITYCKCLMAMGTPDNLAQAEQAIDKLIEDAEILLNNRFQLIELKIMRSGISLLMNRKQESVKVLNEAIILAKPIDFFRPFLESFGYCAPLLETDNVSGENEQFLREILLLKARLDAYGITVDSNVGSTVPPGNELTKREVEIIQFVSQGLRNKEIAERLFLSDHTVKMHLKRAFVKLDVDNRIKASIKAKEMGLLDQPVQ